MCLFVFYFLGNTCLRAGMPYFGMQAWNVHE